MAALVLVVAARLAPVPDLARAVATRRALVPARVLAVVARPAPVPARALVVATLVRKSVALRRRLHLKQPTRALSMTTQARSLTRSWWQRGMWTLTWRKTITWLSSRLCPGVLLRTHWLKCWRRAAAFRIFSPLHAGYQEHMLHSLLLEVRLLGAPLFRALPPLWPTAA